jgi:hypothetical protein
MSWYLVTGRWDYWDSIVSPLKKEHSSILYKGIGDDVWPLMEYWPLDSSKNEGVIQLEKKLKDERFIQVHKRLMANRKYIKCSNGWNYCCCDFQIAKEYFLKASEIFDDLILLEVEKIKKELLGYHGIDFGNPEGGYSVINSEIIGTDNEVILADKYLNHFGLFRCMEVCTNYLSQRKRNDPHCEDITSYIPVKVKILLERNGEGDKRT